MSIALQIILEKPPANVVFGLQKGSGNDYQTVQVQTANGGNLIFDFTAEVKGDKEKDELPDFKGPFVQGPRMGRFIYLDIGGYAKHSESPVGGRMKIPLTGITWPIVDQLNENTRLETRVAGTGKNGGPNYATVKPFMGWSIKTS